MSIEELLDELNENGIKEKFEPILLHSTKITLMIETIEKLEADRNYWKQKYLLSQRQ